MKKMISLVLVAVMALSMVACGNNAAPETTAAPTEAQVPETSALEILETVWAQFGEDEKFFVMGGDFDAPVDGKAGKVNIKNVENTTATLHITEEDLGKVTEAASITHMMNANTFTCAAFQVKSEDAEAFISSLKDSIKATQWMCGFPETLIIYTVDGEYVVAAFGNGEAIDNFEAGLNDAFGASAVLNVEEALA
jgi:hypothetical protein